MNISWPQIAWVSLCMILGSALLTSCRQNKPTDDPAKLKQVLFNYFDGIKDKDHKKMQEATTDDFIAYEEGKVYNNDSVFRDMDRISPYKAVFEFDNFRIDVDSRFGHMTYFEHAEFLVRDTIKFDLRFL